MTTSALTTMIVAWSVILFLASYFLVKVIRKDKEAKQKSQPDNQ